MQHTNAAYLFKGNHYCTSCIAQALLESPPWSSFTPRFEVGWDSERDLKRIAKKFKLDRDDADALNQSGFPIKISDPLSQPTFCSECLRWFPTNTGGQEINTQPHIMRHNSALLDPQGHDETVLSSAFSLLVKMKDSFSKGDQHGVRAIEDVASGALIMLNFPTGRIDQGKYDEDVRELVLEAGGNPENI